MSDLDTLMGKFNSDTGALILEARKVIQRSFPKNVEQVKLGWGVIWYGTGPKMSEQVIVIHPHRDYINLGFAAATELADPKGMLEGSGKRIRHVKIADLKQLKDPAVRALIKNAVALGPPNWPGRKSRKV